MRLSLLKEHTLPPLAAKLGAWAHDFVLSPTSARPLAALRIGIAGLLLVQAFVIAPSLLLLYGGHGFVQWPIVHELMPAGVPRVAWLVETLGPLGVSAENCVRGTFVAYVAALACLVLGWHTRVAAVTAWLAHLTLSISGGAGIYGVDTFARIALFYCIVFPVGRAHSLDVAAGRASSEPSLSARVGLRVLQLHLCIAYLAAGLAKGVHDQWWTGEALWLALNQPTLAQVDISWLAWTPGLAMLACWGTVIIEAGYAIFIWPRLSRKAWLSATVLMHAGIALFMGLVFFGLLMIVLNVAAFGFDEVVTRSP